MFQISATNADRNSNFAGATATQPKPIRSLKQKRSISELIQNHKSAWRSYSYWLLKCDSYSIEISREVAAVQVGHLLEGSRRTPILVCTHEEIDSYMTPPAWIGLSDENRRRCDEAIAAKHKELDDSNLALAQLKDESGFAQDAANLTEAEAREFRAINALLDAKPKTFKEMSLVAKYFLSRHRQQVLPDRVMPEWLRTIAKVA